MFVDARELIDDQEVVCDVCVIGAGAAGISIAHRLTGRGLDIVVLESGGERLDTATQDLYIGETTGQPYFDLATARLRFFGGSTNHWGGTCRPFADVDFDDPPGGAVPGWPIRLSDVMPYYDDAAELCGLKTPVSELDDVRAGDLTSPLPLDPADFDQRYNQIVDKSRRNFADRYLDELAEAGDVSVHLWANAIEITTDPSGTVASGARVGTLSGVRYTVTSRIVVLAVGGIENPRLLLASTRAKSEGLGNDHGLVGRFFMEHPRFVAAQMVPATVTADYDWYRPHVVDGARYQGYVGLSETRRRGDDLTDVQLQLAPRFASAFEDALRSRTAGTLTELENWLTDGGDPPLGSDLLRISEDLATLGDWFVPGGPLPVPLPNVLSRLVRGNSAERTALVPGLFGDTAAYAWSRGVGQPPVEYIDVVARIAQVPNADSRVSLTSEVDELGMGRVELHWELDQADRDGVVRAVELFGAELASLGLARTQLLFDEDADWPPDTSGGWHHMGTTRMSTDPSDGVVDANCRVHGVDNLFIAGSSVFATAGAGTPTLTLVALALRLADHLTREVL